MTTLSTQRPAVTWNEPAGLAPRGTVILLTGRGETATTYERFARRISADAYKVRIVQTRLDDLERTRTEVAALLDTTSLPGPKILAGSDIGATFAADWSHDLSNIDALILAGLVVPGARPLQVNSWDTELETRTACPAHRRKISADDGFARGSLGGVPDALADLRVRSPKVPTLIVHGGDDPLVPADTAIGSLFGADSTQAAIVSGGRHDILNDVTHRSVAATIILFLESLKLGPTLPTIVQKISTV